MSVGLPVRATRDGVSVALPERAVTRWRAESQSATQDGVSAALPVRATQDGVSAALPVRATQDGVSAALPERAAQDGVSVAQPGSSDKTVCWESGSNTSQWIDALPGSNGAGGARWGHHERGTVGSP